MNKMKAQALLMEKLVTQDSVVRSGMESSTKNLTRQERSRTPIRASSTDEKCGTFTKSEEPHGGYTIIRDLSDCSIFVVEACAGICDVVGDSATIWF